LKKRLIAGEQTMTQLPRLALLAALSLTLLPAHAQKILPGLWEFSSGDIQVDGQQMPGMTRCSRRCRTCLPNNAG
jgi:hypothetical protein